MHQQLLSRFWSDPSSSSILCIVHGEATGKPVSLVGWSVVHKGIQHDKGKVQL